MGISWGGCKPKKLLWGGVWVLSGTKQFLKNSDTKTRCVLAWWQMEFSLQNPYLRNVITPSLN